MDYLKKDDIDNLSYKDITNLILEHEKKGLNTLMLFTMIIDALELPKSVIDTKVGEYYTSLTTDKRFVLIDGLWDLRKRHTSDKVIVKVDDEDDEIVEENEENNNDVDNETNFDKDEETEDEVYDDNDDDLSDLVVIDDEEIESE